MDLPEFEFPGFRSLPFADPIARGFTYERTGHYYTLALPRWQDSFRRRRALKRMARDAQKHGLYDDYGVRGGDDF